MVGWVGWLLTLENPSGVDAGLAISIREAYTVTQQAACHREVRKRVNAWNRVARGQGSKLVAPGDEEPIGAHREYFHRRWRAG